MQRGRWSGAQCGALPRPRRPRLPAASTRTRPYGQSHPAVAALVVGESPESPGLDRTRAGALADCGGVARAETRFVHLSFEVQRARLPTTGGERVLMRRARASVPASRRFLCLLHALGVGKRAL
jgi:hypothetical protein